MKRLLSVIAVMLVCGSVKAAELSTPTWSQIVTEAFYMSTECSVNLYSMMVTTPPGPTFLHAVNVINPGSQDASFTLYNNRISTKTANRICTIDTSAKNSYLFDIYCDSGILVNNNGTTPATVLTIYRKR